MAKDQYLSQKEIDEFLDDLDHNKNGYIEYDEVEKKLDDVHKEIAPTPKPHHLHHEDRDDEQRHKFLRGLMATNKTRMPRKEFGEIVKTWNVPSMHPEKNRDEEHNSYMKSIPLGRRIRAFWNVRGPEVLFMVLVIGLQIGLGTWQLVKYLVGPYTHVCFLLS
jgi:dual oxidase